LSRILVTGKNGQVGFELLSSLAGQGQVIAVGREQMDLSQPDSIRRTVREINPDLIVNAGAYTAVDQAESEPELAMAVNGIAPGILAEEAKRLGVALIHYSTDYVFDGAKAAPYTEDDPPCPINVYGRTKLAGERAIQAVDVPHLILRTGWIYGMRGKNFLLTILRLAKERDELRIVDDQVGAPTWSRALAGATAGILTRLGYGKPGFRDACARQQGIYNLSAAGQTSWHGFAAAILAHAASTQPAKSLRALERVPVLKPIPTEQYPLPARRPRYSVLGNAKLQRAFGVAMPDWKISLAECMRGGTQ
jgi:dTDP-4-dehydrorhamnose reductase